MPRVRASRATGFLALAGRFLRTPRSLSATGIRVAHLMLSSKKGMSALQIQRMMGFGSYETAHSMCHKIRAALIAPEEKLGGIVEVDETWVGGKDQNRHWNKRHHGKTGGGTGKTAIIGAVERKGNVVARVLDHVNAQERCRVCARSRFRTRLACWQLTIYAKIYRLSDRISARERSRTNESNTLSVLFTPTRLTVFGRSSSVAWLARSTK